MKSRTTVAVILILLFSIPSSINSYSQNIDSTALKIVKSHLKLISDFLKNGETDSRFYNAGSITFLTRLTGIASESDGNFFGQSHPTQSDYQKWSDWLELYQRFLSYDRKKGVIIVHREVDAPGW